MEEKHKTILKSLNMRGFEDARSEAINIIQLQDSRRELEQKIKDENRTNNNDN